MKRIFILFISVVLLFSVSIAGNNSTTPIYTSYTPKKEIKKQQKEKKSTKRLGEKNRAVALILCLFLGWFAIHRWYLGTSDRSKFLLSIFYLLLSFFLYIHVILDFLCILFGKMDFYLDNPGIFIWAMILF